MRSHALLFLRVFPLALVLLFPGMSHAMPRGSGAAGFRMLAPYWGYGGWGGPYWGYWPWFDNMGEIKIRDSDKHDQVYLNGSLAGPVKKMKNIYLVPGSYDIQIRRDGRPLLSQNVYVLGGKSIQINVDPRP